MKKYPLILSSIALISVTAMTSCKHGDTQTLPAEEVIKDSAKATTVTNLDMLLQNIPAPTDIAKELSKEGIQLNAALLNSPDKGGSYTGTSQQAVNMGIYGADLGYLTSYNQMSQATGSWCRLLNWPAVLV